MKPLFSLLSLLGCLLAAPMARADQDGRSVWADGRFEIHSATYYTTYTADFAVSLDAELPWGSRVRVRAGLGGIQNDWTQGGRETTLEWKEIGEWEAVAVSPYVWTAKFSKTLHERSWARFYSKLQYVFIIDLPDGETIFQRGNASSWGFYEAALPLPGTIPVGEEPAYRRLSTYTVARD